MNIYNKKLRNMKNHENLDYKDIDILKKFVNEQNKILSRRSTGLSTKQQKKVTKAIKRARMLALLPFINKD
uniref:Ribosomal protein S18 n=1 Tax=Anotrichium furcellatum TaxID=41999 RepID=A0A4D6WLI4_9FLOR|nr:ribosomal protein S18 [Anotrichium furcellatum]